MKKKMLTGMLAAMMTLSLLGGCGTVESSENISESASESASEATEVSEVSETAEETENTENAGMAEASEGDAAVVRVGAMSGPTAMGMVKLMSDAEAGTTENTYEFADIADGASSLVAPIASGELDIAAVPSNLAANLYKKTEGGIQVLAVNTEGVLYLVSRDAGISSWADLSGKTVYMTGEGAVPEYTVRYQLEANEITDCTLEFHSEATEVLSYVSADENAIAILPQPYVTAACAQVEGLQVLMDLNEEWNKLGLDAGIVTGVVIVRKEFAEAHPEAVDTFLKEYEASVAYTEENPEDAAALMEQYGIVGKAAIAQKALPNCHLTFQSGEEMKQNVSGFLNILYEQNPESVGGGLPDDDFYYGCN